MSSSSSSPPDDSTILSTVLRLEELIKSAEVQYDAAYEEFCELDDEEGKETPGSLQRRHVLRKLMTRAQGCVRDAKQTIDLIRDSSISHPSCMVLKRRADLFLAECHDAPAEEKEELKRLVAEADEASKVYHHEKYLQWVEEDTRKKKERDEKATALDGQRAFIRESLLEVPDDLEMLDSYATDIIVMQIYKEFIVDQGVEPVVSFDHRDFTVNPEDPVSVQEYADTYHALATQYHSLKYPAKKNAAKTGEPAIEVRVDLLFEQPNGEINDATLSLSVEDFRIFASILGARSVGKRRTDLIAWCEERMLHTFLPRSAVQIYVQIDDHPMFRLLK